MRGWKEGTFGIEHLVDIKWREVRMSSHVPCVLR